MKIGFGHAPAFVVASIAAVLAPAVVAARSAPQTVELNSGWRMQFADKTPQDGAQIASANFDSSGWYPATVPGTALTTLVNDHVYPEPLYGENIRPETIPDGMAYESYWYRTTVEVPKSYAGRRVWLNFDGINYAAEVWVNGAKLGTIRGAFVRGIFDITSKLTPGSNAVVAVLVSLAPDETRTIEIHAAASDLDGHETTIAVDGWNTTAAEAKSGGVVIEPNHDAEPDLQPVTGFAEDGTSVRVPQGLD